MYYKLTNYYQNHRRYVQSYNSDQFKGDPVSASTLDGGECDPLSKRDNLPIYPCGLIANSVFNGMQLLFLFSSIGQLIDLRSADTFSVPTLIQAADSTATTSQVYNMTDRGITWPEEGRKYSNTRYQLGQAVPPPNWIDRFPNGYTAENPFPDLSEDEHFQVWMRTAGLPTFRKLYYRNDNENMLAGRYSIDIFTSKHTCLSSTLLASTC